MDETPLRQSNRPPGHLKHDHRLKRNRLKGTEGDALNILLSAAAMNFGKLLDFLYALFLSLWQGRSKLTLFWTPA